MRSKALQIGILTVLALAVVILAVMLFRGYTGISDMFTQIFKGKEIVPPEEVFQQYTACIEEGRYADMYAMLDAQSQLGVTQDDFTVRNQNIYEGIGAANIAVVPGEFDEEASALQYQLSMDTSAGQVAFSNAVSFAFEKEEGIWRIVWNDSLIFPDLEQTDKVRVSTQKAKRGDIFDRNGRLLAGGAP